MKKKIIVALLLCVMVLSTVLAFAGCAPKKLVGFDIELAEMVAQELGVEVKFQFIDWDTKEIELNGKNIDLIWNGFTINADRQEQMQIGTPYMNNKQVAVIRKADKDKYNSLENIMNAAFVFEGGSTGETAAKLYEFKNATAVTGGQIDAMTEIKAGTSDIAIVDSVLANYYCQEGTSYSNLMIIPNLVLFEEKYGIAARKGDVGTIDKINTSLAKLQENGELKKLAEKYELASELCDVSYESKWDSLSDEEKAGWNYIQEKGNFIVGYTLYAPIAFKE
ncbi:MAG: transporter substrate-binding domain-containing protein [Clostridia bacterium]|nr:transporter substrate-binding domain-containing protein [Clostridia bacterium]